MESSRRRRSAVFLLGLSVGGLLSGFGAFVGYRLGLESYSVVFGLSLVSYFIAVGGGSFELERYVGAEFPWGVSRGWGAVSLFSFLVGSIGVFSALQLGFSGPWPWILGAGLTASSGMSAVYLLRRSYFRYGVGGG